jgi:hypothetical protein
MIDEKTPLESLREQLTSLFELPDHKIPEFLSALLSSFDVSISGEDTPLLTQEFRYLLQVYNLGYGCGKADDLKQAREFNKFDAANARMALKNLNHLRPMNACYVACPKEIVDAGKCRCMNKYRNSPAF